MNWDHLLTGMILLVAFYLLFFIGKRVNDLLHREYDLLEELVEKDNPALALALTGYYFGLVFSIGGVLVGPSLGIVDDLIDLGIYGLLSIILLNISWLLCDKVILHKFKVSDELIRDRNQGTGAVAFGICLASGLVIYGAVSGEGGTIWTAAAFWAIGQVMLILAVFIYNWMIPYNVHAEIEKDNVAAGVSLVPGFVGSSTLSGSKPRPWSSMTILIIFPEKHNSIITFLPASEPFPCFTALTIPSTMARKTSWESILSVILFIERKFIKKASMHFR